MSSAKRELERLEQMRAVATTICQRTGVLAPCAVHDDVLLDQLVGDDPSPYKLGNSLITAGDDLVEVFHGDRKALAAAVKDAIADHASDCPTCAKWDAE